MTIQTECADWGAAAPGDAEHEHFGWCPECGGSNGHLNIGREHWYHCHRHRTKWCVGSNLFSAWRHENDAIWEANYNHLADYREVDSTTPTPAMLDALMKGGA
jgi:hypothetical protein